MPQYRLVRPLPDEVKFRNGSVRFDIFEGLYGAHNFRVQKIGTDCYSALTLASAMNATALHEKLRTGFEVPEGPHGVIMDGLVKLGVAEKLR